MTADGRPYLVMEYVDGVPITEHCRVRGLPVRERLALVQTVCRAVEFAHQHLVVHRDLKPGNVLVTPDGQVKLLDFGVAKVLGDASHVRPGAEPPTLLALTPAYAAPEQFRRGRVTTATDVYGLGALAYELVAGRRPHALDGLSLGEAERVVSETEPAPPVGGRRLTDLDHVLLTALRADSSARYATPGAFADDIQRVLDGKPVRARTPTTTYRLARFVRRHRARVAAGTVAAAALLATTVVAVQQARAAGAQARRAEAARALSEATTARAQRINRFLQGVLATANPSWYIASAEKGPTVTVLRALELAAERMERDLADDPETRADIHHTLGDTYHALGRYASASRHFERSLVLRERVFRAPHPKIADALFYAAVARSYTGDWDAVDSLYGAALAMQRQRDEGNNLPYLLEGIGALRADAGDYRGSLALYQEMLAVVRARHPDDHYARTAGERQVANAYLRLGERRRAWPLARSAARRHDNAGVVSLLAALTAADGDLARADSLYRAATALASSDPRPLLRVTPRIERVWAVLIPQARWAEARAELDTLAPLVRDAYQRRPGYANVVARTDALAALVAAGEGRTAAAERDARRALAAVERIRAAPRRYVPAWEEWILARSALGHAHLAAGRVDAARQLARENLRAVEASGLRDALAERVRADARAAGLTPR
jgi:serine/threonine-protein kinase